MRAVALGLTAILLGSLFVPLAFGQADRTTRDDPRHPRAHEERSERPERQDAERRAQHAAKASRGTPLDIQVSASGLDRENRSYSLQALGVADCRVKQNDTSGVSGIHCRGRLNLTVLDDNGTVLREGMARVMLHAHQNETGAWHWALVSLGLAKRHGAAGLFVLHGANATQDADGLVLEDGKGGAMLKQQGEDPRLRMRLSGAQASVEGL